MEKYTHEEVRIRPDVPARFEIYEDRDHLVSNHWHDSLEVIYLLGGELAVTVNGRERILPRGDFAVINSRDIHSTSCRSLCRVLLLQIPGSFLKQAITDYDRIRFEEAANEDGRPDFLAVLDSMADSLEHKPAQFTLRFTGLLYEFLYLLMTHRRVEVDKAVRIRSEKNLRRLEKVTEYVKEHYASPIPLAEGAAAVSLNPEYFCRFFKKYMGMTFLDYVNTVRLSHVHDDLLHTDLSIGVILENNGCSSYKQFMRKFREAYGCTPSALRKNILAGGEPPQ